MVSRSGLYCLLEVIGCQPTLLKLTQPEDMQATIQYDGANSDSFLFRKGVKQGCVLGPTLFGICFAILLEVAFKN